MTKTDDQIREIADDVVQELVNERGYESTLIRWIEQRYSYLSHDDINRVAASVGDAKVSVTW